MHEMSIAENLMDQILQIAADNNAKQIVTVEVVCGEMQQVVPEALLLAFDTVKAGTPAADATLTIREQSLQAKCRSCGHEFSPAIDNFLCPHCEDADVELIAGDQIILQSMECEVANEAGQ